MAQELMASLISPLLSPPTVTEGPLVLRQNACSFCGAAQAHVIAKGEYWDLKSVNFVRCPSCDLVQVDPMLSDEEMSQGCLAYYLRESQREGIRNLNRNRVRSFRKGVYFGLRLKSKGLSPEKILEMGPGDGFFSRGVHYVFPEAEVTVIDIVPEVVQTIERVHGFKGIVGSLEGINVQLADSAYDLVIARDIIEHVARPQEVLQQVRRLLKDNGCFHFITPNGYEDIWGAYCSWVLTKKPAAFLLNHVNYFPAPTLEKKLNENGFKKLDYFIYDLSDIFKGRGRKIIAEHSDLSASDFSAQKTIQENSKDTSGIQVQLQNPMDLWWVQFRPLAFLYCWLKEHIKWSLPAHLNAGHEIYGLFQIKK